LVEEIVFLLWIKLRPNMQRITLRFLLQYLLPLTLTLFMLITVKRIVITDGGYDKLWGMPLGFITNNFGCSGCYDVYVLAMLFDLLLQVVIALILLLLIEWLGVKLKTHWIGIVLGCLITAFWVLAFYLITFQSHFKLENDVECRIVSWHFCWGLQNDQ
jgi:hypothetical protein